MDVKWYGTTATAIATFDAGNNKLDLAGVAITSNAAINTSGTTTSTGAVNAASFTATGACNAANATFTTFVNSATGTFTNCNAATFVATTAVNTVDVNFTGEITPSANGFFSSKAATTQSTESLTANASHFDSMIQITQANATTITLPAPAAGNLGAKITVACLTNAAHVVSSANTIVALTSIVADTLTAAETDKTGQIVTLQSDASKWVVVGMTGTWTVGVA
jgi:hypothetical protein